MNQRRNISKKLRFRVLKRDGFACVYCGRPGAETRLEIDHIQPVAAGGDNSYWNLVAACVDCNGSKTDASVPLTGDGYREYLRLRNNVALISACMDSITIPEEDAEEEKEEFFTCDSFKRWFMRKSKEEHRYHGILAAQLPDAAEWEFDGHDPKDWMKLFFRALDREMIKFVEAIPTLSAQAREHGEVS